MIAVLFSIDLALQSLALRVCSHGAAEGLRAACYNSSNDVFKEIEFFFII